MRRILAFSLMLLMLLCGAAYAQYTGTIRGVVMDPAGAVIAGAEVTVINTATGATRTATTSGEGEFTVTALPAGMYDIHVKQGSFKEFVSRGVELHGSSSVVVDAQLTMGSVSDQVVVEANAVQVQTDSAQVGSVVDGNQVRELPLNGRSFAQLLFLQPGVSAADGLDTKNKGLLSGTDFSVNGNPVTNNLFLVDGANNNDLGSNRTILIYPSVDAIAEFKMLRNSYGAEYGQASGAIISIITKSGSNQWHGSGYYFGRNDALNAANFFAARAGTKDVLRRNDYGYSIGGPIKKDKLFFFWSEEWNKEKRGGTRQSCVPTAAERAGDFSADWLNNPTGSSANTTCQQTPPSSGTSGGLPIPILDVKTDPANEVGGLDPAGILLADQFPLPNFTPTTPGGNNWFQSLGSSVNWRQESIRVDYNITRKHTATFRYTQDAWNNPSPNAQVYWGDDPYPAVEGSWAQPSKSIIGKVTSVLGNTMTNEAQFSYSNNRINATLGGNGTQGNIGTDGLPAAELNPAAYVAALNAAIPTNFPASFKKAGGIPPGSGWNPGIGYGATLWLIAPWNNSSDLYQFRDDLSKVYGSHTVKMGASYGYSGKNEPGYGSQDQPGFGNFKSVANAYGNNTTGNALADLLTPDSVFGSSENSKNLFAQARWHDIEWYVQDNWKIRKNLTLEYGFRWSFLMQPYAPNDKITNWDPKLYDPNGVVGDACNGIVTVPGTDPCGDSNREVGSNFSSGTPGKNRALADNGYHNIAPRFGLSWDPWSNGKTAVRFGFGQFFQRERVSTITAVLGQNAPFSVNAGANRTLDIASPPAGGITGSPNAARDTSPQIPNSWGWNFVIEREIAKDTAIEVGYVGNRGLHLTSDFDANAPLPGTRLANALCRPDGLGGPNDCAVPGRPYSQTGFGGISEFAHRGTSIYHGLQTLFRTRLGNRSQIQASYTWSHTISNVDLGDSSGSGFQTHTTTDPFNPNLDRGNSRINRPHIFVANAVYYLPKMAGSQAFVKQTLGGWEAATIFTAESGVSRDIFVGGNLVDGNAFDAQGHNITIGNPSGLGGVSDNQLRLVQTGNCNSGTGKKVGGDTQFFNPDAFTLVGYQFGTPGSTGRGACLGPKRVVADLSFSKNWDLTEKVKLQFRLDLFNAFNHANFRTNSINTGWVADNKVFCGDSPCSPDNNVVTSLNQAGPKSTFGLATSTDPGREIQYSLRFTF